MNRLFSSAPKMKKKCGSAQYMNMFYFHCKLSIDVKTHEIQCDCSGIVEGSGPHPVDHDSFGVKRPFHRSYLRSSENTNVYIMINYSRKLRVI